MACAPALGATALGKGFLGAPVDAVNSKQSCLPARPAALGLRAAVGPLAQPSQPSQAALPSQPSQRSDRTSVAARAFASSSAIGSVVAAASAISTVRRGAPPPPSQEASQQEASYVSLAERSQELGAVKELLFPKSRNQSRNQSGKQSRRPPTEKPIQLIATDVDGTLLDSQQRLSERTERALRLAMEQGVKVVLATGKARGPWVPEIMRRLQLDCPGVFLQGLMIYSAHGALIYERTLEEEVAQDVVSEAESRGITLVAYCGERILCSETNLHTDRLIGYGEPIPEAVGPLSSIIGSTPIHKLLFMADDPTLSALRRDLERQLAGRATLVTALHGMLEVLPLGASKAGGLEKVLGMLGVHQSHVLAAGDGENDIEMLRMAGLAVAMGNASSRLQSEAHYVSPSNDCDGLAHAVETFVLKPGFWCWD